MSSFDQGIARTHYEALQKYLEEYLAKAPADSRLVERLRLARLTEQRLGELSTDVYDDLIRRKTNTPENEIPYLPSRDEFHSTRNLARQKIATLRPTRFEDLSSDVYSELLRRYPELQGKTKNSTDLVGSCGPAYDELESSTEIHTSSSSDASNFPPGSWALHVPEDRAMDSGHGTHVLRRRQVTTPDTSNAA